MAIVEIQSHIEEIEKDGSLCEEKNFDRRLEAIDFIGFQVIDRIESLLHQTNPPDELILLKHRAEKLKQQLEEIDINLFKKLRQSISNGGYRGKEFKDLVTKYTAFNLDDNKNQDKPGYDNLDIFVNGLLSSSDLPEQTKDLEPGMVYYQKTPARIIFQLVEQHQFKKEGVFFDLGSGLGQAAILVNLLTGILAKGIEFEPAFCAYARDCAAALNLSGVTFINADARNADYADGTVFFMYTPFKGEILRDVLAALRKESLQRKIKLITYGPCTAEIALQSWLAFAGTKHTAVYKLGVFISL